MTATGTLAPKPVRAVQYVRMSTDMQEFSIAAQKAVIADYAKSHGFEIVKTYADEGRSGLSLKGRVALQQLLSDALSADRAFDAILVQDVSRWGRFQDPDQSAHYEFICRQAGVRIAYCSEPFEENANSITSVVKHLKRVMASEYSRELSVKLSRAHLEHAREGYRQGGSRRYGFRRLLVDDQDVPQMLLGPGEHKALRSDRVRFCLGPPEELAVIRKIFDLYVCKKRNLEQIAAYLRRKGIKADGGRPWRGPTVRKALTNELVVGRYIYNRTTQKLHTPKRNNPQALWTTASDVVEPMISETLFAAAQERINRRAHYHHTDQRMLEVLKALFLAKGRVSHGIISRAGGVPSIKTYVQHFGSIEAALKLIGYNAPLCISGKDAAWSVTGLKAQLRGMYDQHGYLSVALIDKDATLPSATHLRKKIGKMPDLYAFAGLPPKSQAEIMAEARSRGALKMIGRPGKKGVRRHWSKKDLIAGLKRLRARYGYLSAVLIEAAPYLPSSSYVNRRFGTLLKAYKAAGWNTNRSEICALRAGRWRGRSKHNSVPLTTRSG
ncbi:MAG TPA: recombinase family protein [Rhizomicrobium sp.]|jgi:DNA invertase Pin-like site-specific DNA recombinase